MASEATGYNIVIAKPEGYLNSAAFDEIGETLRYGFQSLGRSVQLGHRIDPRAQNILLGSNLLLHCNLGTLPAETILYNFEQLHDGTDEMTTALRALLQRYQVWDYSPRNIAYLKQIGCRFDPRLVPLGFAAPLHRIDKAAVQDIDVLFYGSLNPRRRAVLAELESRGATVVVLKGVYGAERDAYIARSKLVLNVHFYETQIFEIARVSYLLSNKKAVVSEYDSRTEIDPDLHGALKLCPYDSLAETCMALLQDDAARADLEQAGFEIFSARKESDILASVLCGEVLSRQPGVASQQAPPATSASLPPRLNIGSGKNHRADCLNLDILASWDPDVCADLADKELIGSRHQSDRFGEVTFTPDMFDEIICNDVIEHIPDLVSAITNCLNLLKAG